MSRFKRKWYKKIRRKRSRRRRKKKGLRLKRPLVSRGGYRL